MISDQTRPDSRREKLQSKLTALVRAASGHIADMSQSEINELKMILGDVFFDLSAIDGSPDDKK